jgi:PAS domain S-box-containing protein
MGENGIVTSEQLSFTPLVPPPSAGEQQMGAHNSLFASVPAGRVARYLTAALSAIAALYLRILIAPVFPVHVPYYPVWAAIAFSAWFCGLGPSIVTTLVAMSGIWFWFPSIPRSYSEEDGTIGIISFLAMAGLIVAIGEAGRRTSARRAAAEREARKSRSQFETFMDNSPGIAYMKDADGRFIYVNRTMRERFQLSAMEGKTDFDFFPAEAASTYRAHDLEVLREGKPREFIEYIDEPDGKRAWLSIKIPVVDPEGNVVLCGKSFDITDRVKAEEALLEVHRELENRVRERTAELTAANESLRELSARLLLVRDEEHRRIARNLHDSVGQLLTALSMNFALLNAETSNLAPELAKTVTGSIDLLDQATREIRTVSHLLHPPLLDEVGLASALRWFVEGFCERSGIEVELEVAPQVDRLQPDVELALFRVVQECLTNIHRHSGSDRARIQLHPKDGWLCLEVKDMGKGIPAEKRVALESDGQIGLGIRGMRERIRLLGGTLEIESNAQGTLVRASLPASQTAIVQLQQDGVQKSSCSSSAA